MSLLLEPGFVPPDTPSVDKIIELRPTWFDEVIDTAEAAAMLGTTANAMNQMRVRREGPPYVRFGARRVGYTRRDIIEYIENAKVTPSRPQPKHARIAEQRARRLAERLAEAEPSHMPSTLTHRT